MKLLLRKDEVNKFEKQMVIITILFAIGTVLTIVYSAFAFGPNDPECYEIGNCDFFEAPFDAMISPFKTVFGDFTFLVIWGIIIGILWLRVSNTMVVAVVGVALAILFVDPSSGEGFGDQAQTVGFVLVAVAIGVAIYQLLTVRTHFPTS